MPLSFGGKIKEARRAKNLTQKELANLIGAKHNSISDWENDKNKPDPDTIELLCGVLDITPNYLLVTSSDDFSPFEKQIIEKYRSLDSYGKETISLILDREICRVNNFKEHIQQLKSSITPISSTYHGRLINYYQRLASAGAGQFVFDDIPVELIEIPDIPEYQNVNYAIGVNGASMEPLYYDGDVLLVESAEQISVGEIGIFIVDGQSYVKKLGENILISLNEDFPNVDIDADTQCLGRVIDKIPRFPELSAADLEALENAANQLSAKKKAQ